MKFRATAWRRAGAFSVLEMMVAAGLLAVIMLGLLQMFYQTERAFRLGVVQADTMESGRSTMELIRRDFQEVAPSGNADLFHFATRIQAQPFLQMDLSPSETRVNALQSFFLISRENGEWRGTRYEFRPEDLADGLGNLYRFDWIDVSAEIVYDQLVKNDIETAPTGYGLVAEGVVNLTLKAYDQTGKPMVPETVSNTVSRVIWRTPEGFVEYAFSGTNLPAAVEVELGVLEPKTLERARALGAANRAGFLRQRAGNVHLFRQRIPIRSTP